jgi:ribosomal protein RSM22 (predicted rRNA methylase)
MISSNKLQHELANNVDAILSSLEAIEIKIKNKDIKGALHTLSLIKDKKHDAQNTINAIKELLERVES